MGGRPTLSLNEWAVLGVLIDHPCHGYDIANELGRGSRLGEAWRLGRPLVYRALDRLEVLELIAPRRTEPGDAAPPRTVYGPTRRGRTAMKRWLGTPVDHVRDVRTELLLKLLLLERLGMDRGELVHAQQAAFDEVVAERVGAEPDGGDVIALWRHHSTAGVAAFLVALGERP